MFTDAARTHSIMRKNRKEETVGNSEGYRLRHKNLFAYRLYYKGNRAVGYNGARNNSKSFFGEIEDL